MRTPRTVITVLSQWTRTTQGGEDRDQAPPAEQRSEILGPDAGRGSAGRPPRAPSASAERRGVGVGVDDRSPGKRHAARDRVPDVAGHDRHREAWRVPCGPGARRRARTSPPRALATRRLRPGQRARRSRRRNRIRRVIKPITQHQQPRRTWSGHAGSAEDGGAEPERPERDAAAGIPNHLGKNTRPIVTLTAATTTALTRITNGARHCCLGTYRLCRMPSTCSLPAAAAAVAAPAWQYYPGGLVDAGLTTASLYYRAFYGDAGGNATAPGWDAGERDPRAARSPSPGWSGITVARLVALPRRRLAPTAFRTAAISRLQAAPRGAGRVRADAARAWPCRSR